MGGAVFSFCFYGFFWGEMDNYAFFLRVFDLEFYQNVKLHLKLMKCYNRLFTYQQLVELCLQIGVSYDEMLDHIICYRKEFRPLMNETLKKQGYIWFGDTISISKEDFEMYSELILNKMNVVVSSFIKEYPDVNYDDLYDFVLETVMKKTGGLFINYKVTKALPFMLYQFLFKHCYNFLKSPFNQDLYFTFDEEKNYFSDTCDNSDGSFIDDYFFLTTEEQEFLKVMSTGIEERFVYQMKKSCLVF